MSRLKRVTAVPGRLFAPRDLPDVGIHYHPNHLRKLWEKGEFPKPIKLSPRKIAWREADIMAWIASRSEYTPDHSVLGKRAKAAAKAQADA